MKHITYYIIALALCLSFAACGGGQSADTSADGQPGGTSQTDATTPAVTTPEFTTPAADFSNMPAQTDIAVQREGDEEILPAYLAVSDLGYAIYLFGDFELAADNGTDTIRPTAESLLLPSIYMTITQNDGAAELPEDTNENGLLTKYHRIQKGGSTFVAAVHYPIEAAEGGSVLLSVMLSTLTTPDGE